MTANATENASRRSSSCGASTRASARCRSCTTSTSPSTPARSPPWSATTAPASPRWSSASAASTRSTRASSSSRASRSPSTARGTPRRSASRSSTRTSRSATTSTSSRTCSSAASRRTGIVLDEADDGGAGRARRSQSLSVRTRARRVRQQVASLSGGQRQTVAIAKAVLWNSKVVILDEPTAALGVAQTEQVLDLVRRLADNGLAVVLISHNMNDVFAGRGPHRRASTSAGWSPQVKHQGRHATPQVVELITAGRSGERRAPSRRASVDERSDGMSAPRPSHVAQYEPGRRRPARRRLGEHVRGVLSTGSRGGDIGALPAVLGAGRAGDRLLDRCGRSFFTAGNFANLLTQGAAITVHRHGPGLRPAARRDRPVGRLHQRRLRGRAGHRC